MLVDMPSEVFAKATYALVISHMNYSYLGLPLNSTQKLQLVQNMVMQQFSDTLLYIHVTPLFFELHWLPVGF